MFLDIVMIMKHKFNDQENNFKSNFKSNNIIKNLDYNLFEDELYWIFL